MTNQSVKLWAVLFDAAGLRTNSSYATLWVLGDDIQVAARKATRFLRKDGGTNIRIKSIISHGTIDVF